MLSLLKLERQEKVLLESTSSSHITLSVLFIWNQTINTFIVHSLENHTRIQTKIDIPTTIPTIPVFRPKRRKTHTLCIWGGTHLWSKYKGVPPRGVAFPAFLLLDQEEDKMRLYKQGFRELSTKKYYPILKNGSATEQSFSFDMNQNLFM